jgi:hypothetical protein
MLYYCFVLQALAATASTQGRAWSHLVLYIAIATVLNTVLCSGSTCINCNCQIVRMLELVDSNCSAHHGGAADAVLSLNDAHNCSAASSIAVKYCCYARKATLR